MGKISAQDVNKLRKTTGAGMMDCKKALVECEGDFEKAIDYLRKKGQKVAAKRADRSASEGVVLAKASQDKTFGVVVCLNCETDFVAKNEEFVAFTNSIVEVAIENRPKDVAALNALPLAGTTVAEEITAKVGKIGEKLEISGYEYEESPCVAAYTHFGNRLATIIALTKGGEEAAEIGHQLAMQVAAMNPVAVDESSVSEEVKDREFKIGREKAIEEGKPENIVERIAEGTLKKFFKENTLLNQDFIRDTKKSVGQYLAEADKDLKVVSFKRLSVGK